MQSVKFSNPRRGMITVEGAAYRLTTEGYNKIMEMAMVGSSLQEVADFLRVSYEWLRVRVYNEECNGGDYMAAQAFTDGYGEFKLKLRASQAALAETNAQMGKWMGMQHLGQKEQQTIDVNKRITVVGTLPDYSQKPEDWQRQFAPEPVRKMLQQAIDEAEVVAEGDDAEVASKDSETGKADG